MPRPLDPSRDLLFGLLALQTGLINQAQLVAAFHAWTQARDRPMAEILAEQGALLAPCLTLVEGLVIEHLRRHANDPERSLAAIGVGRSTRECLAQIGDPRLDASLTHVGPGSVEPDSDPDRTASYSVGTATSDGQRFRVLRPHAQGGLGAVFVALDAELHREVALKQILDHHADDPISRQRFLLEAEITGGLEHPGIVPVYGLGSYGDGRPYYAMRLIRGDSLKAAIERFHTDEGLKADPGRRSLELRQLLRRFTDVCNAIEYAHSRGVLHRDIKPGNVILGKYGETLVVDWGLAKAVGRADPASAPGERTLVPSTSSSLAQTLPGSALGTPAYMSPEQASGELDRLGPRSDVHSLGATLYCLLSGGPPFVGEDAGMILRQVQNGEFPSPRKLDASIDPALEAVCLKAMALKPDDRYSSARALADDIDRWLADEPVSALRDRLFTGAWRWVRHHRTFTTSAAAVALVTLTAFGIALRREQSHGTRLATAYHEVNEANTRLTQANAELARSNAEADRWLNRAMGSIEDYFTGVSEEALLGGNLPPALRERLLARPLAFYVQLTRELASQHDPSDTERLLLAEGRQNLGRILMELGRADKARGQQEAAIALLEVLIARQPEDPGLRDSLAWSYSYLGNALRDTGRPLEATEAHRKSIAIWESLAAREPHVTTYRQGLAWGYKHLGELIRDAGRLAEAANLFEKAITAAEAVTAERPDDPGFSRNLDMCYHELGNLLRVTFRPMEAAEAYKKSIAVVDPLISRYPDRLMYQRDAGFSYSNLCDVLRRTGRAVQASDAIRRAVSLWEALVSHQPDVSHNQQGLGWAYEQVGEVLRETGHAAEASEAQSKTVAIFGALAAKEPDVPVFQHGLAMGHHRLGLAIAEAGRQEGAITAHRKALAIYQDLAARQSGDPLCQARLAWSYGYLGLALRHTGNAAEASRAFREQLTISRRLTDTYPDNVPFRGALARSHANIGVMLTEAGQLSEALVEYDQSRTTFQKLADAHPDVIEFRCGLASVCTKQAAALLSLGRTDDARASCERAIGVYETLIQASPEITSPRSGQAEALLRSGQVRQTGGDAAGAAADWRRAVGVYEGLPPRFGEPAFFEACCHALLSGIAGRAGSGMSAIAGETESRRAVEMLRRLAANGFNSPDAARTESGLDPLRARSDFLLLMMDLAFPAEPFSKDTDADR